MEPAQSFYSQSATHFRLRIFIRPDAFIDGRLVIELAERFLADLLFPAVRVISLDTKRPGMGQRLNMGEFSPRRWNLTLGKLRGQELAVVLLKAETPDFPNQKIWLSIHVNPPGGDELIGAETVEIFCSVSYLRHLAASPQKIEALLNLGALAWNGAGAAAYGYGNLAISPKRLDWSKMLPGDGLPWNEVQAPAERVHDIPVAHVGEIDMNLESLYVNGAGIKGAFWANFLTAAHVTQAGGEAALGAALAGLRIEPLAGGGLLVVATGSPLPEDSEDNRSRFRRLAAALKPAFLSREATSPNKRALLGYFYREHP